MTEADDDGWRSIKMFVFKKDCDLVQMLIPDMIDAAWKSCWAEFCRKKLPKRFESFEEISLHQYGDDCDDNYEEEKDDDGEEEHLSDGRLLWESGGSAIHLGLGGRVYGCKDLCQIFIGCF